jgi:hypothetical protein
LSGAAQTRPLTPQFLAIPSTLHNTTSTTTCPYIGPGSRTSFTNYTYLSLKPTPLDCIAACDLLPANSSSRVALLSPSSANVDDRGSSWACACADAMGTESYTTPCGQASWYAVAVTAADGSDKGAGATSSKLEGGMAGVAGAGPTSKAQRRSRT